MINLTVDYCEIKTERIKEERTLLSEDILKTKNSSTDCINHIATRYTQVTVTNTCSIYGHVNHRPLPPPPIPQKKYKEP